MNYNTAIFLISDEVRAVVVSYEDRDDAPRTMFKTFDKSIEIDTFVVVPTDTRHKMTVCKVVEVDVEPDLDADTVIGWIIGTVTTADFDEITAQEQGAIATIKSAEKRKKREELREALAKNVGDDLKALPMYSPRNDKEEEPS